MGSQMDRVRINVGGKIFETTATTLAKAGRNSLFGAMFDDNWDLRSDTTTDEHFIDRNPDCFSVLLDLLRTGELYIPSNLPEKLFYREALFYGLLDQVRSAKWGPFDGNHLHPCQSVTGRAPNGYAGAIIRASPDGGCCVAQGSFVHVYDWMMEEHPLINLNYKKVNDAGWIDPNNIVITTGGGIGLFSSSNGELRHKFDLVESYTAGAMSFSSDHKIFASCREESGKGYGVGIWDQNTGKQVDFYGEYGSLGYADKLQWLQSTNCLLVANLFRLDRCSISLLDFRVKKIVECWSDGKRPNLDEQSWEDRRVRDTIAMEDTSSVCVVNRFGDLGFIDLRKQDGGVSWISKRCRSMVRWSIDGRYKLGHHQGQLFSLMRDCISVFCGSDWVLCSMLRRSNDGHICDISIGGDRLFALHTKKNVFDIWETPRPLIM